MDHLIELHEFFFEPACEIDLHSGLWGDFNFSLDGLLQLQIEDQIFITPLNYGLWIPPQVAHCCLQIDRKISHFICIKVHPSLSGQIATTPKTLVTQPFFHLLVKEALKQKEICLTSYRHLLQVIFDQLKNAESYDQYLPKSNHPILSEILEEVGRTKRFNEATSKILQEFKLSERHIFRLCLQELEISLTEWRNRAKLLFAIAELQNKKSIKEVSYQLGYQHSSSFIEFFKRYTGKTPSQI